MRTSLCFLYLSLAFIALANAGTCPKYPLIRDFDFRKYLGLWYQQDKKQAGWEAPGRCWKAFYLRDPKNGQYKMRMIFENTITGKAEEYDSQLSLQGPRKPSVIKYTIPLTFLEDEYQVLATDYESFSVEYKCKGNGFLDKQESVFLLTREKNPSPIILQRAYAIMHHYGIDIRKLERVDQTCGGLRLASATASGSSTTPEDADYEYYNSPDQALPENRRYHIQADATEGYDYFDAPPIITESPYKRRPRPPPKKKFWRPNFSIFG